MARALKLHSAVLAKSSSLSSFSNSLLIPSTTSRTLSSLTSSTVYSSSSNARSFSSSEQQQQQSEHDSKQHNERQRFNASNGKRSAAFFVSAATVAALGLNTALCDSQSSSESTSLTEKFLGIFDAIAYVYNTISSFFITEAPLLPELPPDPYGNQPRTAVIAFEHVLADLEWDRDNGWTVHKRPEVQQLVDELHKRGFELVLWSNTMQMDIAEKAKAFDEKQQFKHFLYKDHTSFKKGYIVKDITRLNRDPGRVILIDSSPGALKVFPNNTIPMAKWRYIPQVDQGYTSEYAAMAAEEAERLSKEQNIAPPPSELELKVGHEHPYFDTPLKRALMALPVSTEEWEPRAPETRDPKTGELVPHHMMLPSRRAEEEKTRQDESFINAWRLTRKIHKWNPLDVRTVLQDGKLDGPNAMDYAALEQRGKAMRRYLLHGEPVPSMDELASLAAEEPQPRYPTMNGFEGNFFDYFYGKKGIKNPTTGDDENSLNVLVKQMMIVKKRNEEAVGASPAAAAAAAVAGK